MQLQERLDKQTKQKLNELKKQNKHKSKRYSRHEILELMDVNKPTYRRGKGGAFRQR